MGVILDFLGESLSKKGNTYRETLLLYQRGLGPEEIATYRNVSPQTIYSHLAYLYSKGNISTLDNFVAWDEVEIIKKAIGAIGVIGESKAMKPIFDYLNESVPYHKIRLAMAVIEKEESNREAQL